MLHLLMNLRLTSFPVRIASDNDSDDDDMSLKPDPKQTKTQQSSIKSFLTKDKEPKPVSPGKVGAMKPKGGKTQVKKDPPKKVVDSDEDESDNLPVVAKKADAPRRAARAVPKKYIELSDDDDGGKDDTFEVSD